MARVFKAILTAALLTVGGASLHAFTLLGPSPATGQPNGALNWQDPSLGVNSQGFLLGGFGQGFEIGGPLNIGEEFRWNVPELSYAFDQSFLNYFGTAGVEAVNAAMKTLNDLPKASDMTDKLTEFPLMSHQKNFQASALNLLDIKSTTMRLMMQQLGLADPLHYMWMIYEERNNTIGNVTFTNYLVIQRNFDAVRFEPTNFINGVQYTYEIRNFPLGNFVDAVEIPVDITAFDAAPVASAATGVGNYYLGLTRDDAGGLRYLYHPNNMNVEQLPLDSEILVTNETETFLTSFDLATFLRETQNTTNSAAQVQALYPDANIVGVTNTTLMLTNVITVQTFFTNFPQNPTPVFISETNTIVQTNFSYEIDNLWTNSVFSDNLVVSQKLQVTLATNIFPPTTNAAYVNRMDIISNYPNGEVYFVPSNTFNFTFVEPVATNISSNVIQTNVVIGDLFAYTNAVAGEVRLDSFDLQWVATNTIGTTNDPATIGALFPGIGISHTNIRQGVIPIVTLTNNMVVTNNLFTELYDYSFYNVFTNSLTNRTWITNRIVEIVANPTAGIDGRPNITNVILSEIVAGGGNATTPSSVDLNPLGIQNDLIFTAKFPSDAYNGVEFRFVDDGNIEDNRTIASYDKSARQVIINLNSELSDAASVVAALSNPIADGAIDGTASRAIMSFGLPNSALDFTANTAGAAGNGLTVKFRSPFSIVVPGPGLLSFEVDADDALVPVDPAAPVHALYDSAKNELTIYVSPGVTSAKNVEDFLDTGIANGLPLFRASYTVSLDLTQNAANDGSDVITLSIPENLSDRSTTGGFDGTKAATSVSLAGPNNDLKFEAITGGVADNGLEIEFIDKGRFDTDRANVTYDLAANKLTIEYAADFTTANSVLAKIATTAATGMTGFRGRYAVSLGTHPDTEVLNDGTGALPFVPFTAALDDSGDASIDYVGDNNDIILQTVPSGGASGELIVALFDINTVSTDAAIATYDEDDNALIIEIREGVTTANTVLTAIMTSTGDGMSAFRGKYTVQLDTRSEDANNGAGVFAGLPTITTLALADLAGNAGIGKLGANVNIAVLDEEISSGEVFIVPTNQLGYEIVNTVYTNASNTTSIVVTNSTFLHTNTSQSLFITNIDLCFFDALVGFSDPTTVQGLFPDVVITRTNPIPGVIVSNTITGMATNLSPYQPALTIPSFVLVTNSATNFAQFYEYEFGNIRTNTTYPFQTVLLVETNVVLDPYAPAGVTNVLTNVTSRSVEVPGPCGSAFIIPTNTNPRIHDYHIIETVLTNVVSFTNVIFSVPVSNAFGGVFSNTIAQVTFATNYVYEVYPIEFRDPRDIGTNGFGLRRETVRPITTHVYGAYPIEVLAAPGTDRDVILCQEEYVTFATNITYMVQEVGLQPASAAGLSLRRGIDKITFTDVTTNYNSILGQAGGQFTPVTNLFPTMIVTNGMNTTQWVRRVVTFPDILFTAEDVGTQTGNLQPFTFVTTDTDNWVNHDGDNGAANLAGPGVIVDPVTITFNTLQATLLNSGPFSLNEADAFRQFRWGSFDGSGAAPIVFPNHESITNIAQEVLQP